MNFPEDYQLLKEVGSEVSVMHGPDKQALIERGAGEGFDFIEITFNEAPYHMALKGFKIFEKPRESKSRGSNATYLANAKTDERVFLLQYMPKNAETSTHYHERTSEAFHSLAGAASLCTLWGNSTELSNNSVNNEAFVVHKVTTGPKTDSLILLEMVHDGAPKRSNNEGKLEDHFYVYPETPRIDIGSKGEYPANDLSNFAAHAFKIDGIECACMEGFLQSLKEPCADSQVYICGRSGRDAKVLGGLYNFQRGEENLVTVYWLGKEIARNSKEFQDLLDRAFAAMIKTESCQKALIASGEAILVHTIGKSDPMDTILTEGELCSRLMRFRSELITVQA